MVTDVPEYQQYMLDVASLQLLQCTDPSVKVVKLWQFKHMKQIFDSLFTLVNPAIRQVSRVIYELQNPVDKVLPKEFTKLLNENAMKVLSHINSFPNMCYITKDNVL